jgi:hypothetical protein
VSLLELMIVLGLLVIIGALAVPALERPLDAEKLRKSAQLVQAHWDKARVHAMQQGQIMVFQYQADSGRFRIMPWMADDVLIEGNTAADPTGPSSTAVDSSGLLGELPEGVKFLTSITLSETRSLDVESQLADLSQSASADGAWSAPVLFYPDGTASTAEVTMVNQTGSYVTLRLRGLTGVARVSEVLSTGTGETMP